MALLLENKIGEKIEKIEPQSYRRFGEAKAQISISLPVEVLEKVNELATSRQQTRSSLLKQIIEQVVLNGGLFQPNLKVVK